MPALMANERPISRALDSAAPFHRRRWTPFRQRLYPHHVGLGLGSYSLREGISHFIPVFLDPSLTVLLPFLDPSATDLAPVIVPSANRSPVTLPMSAALLPRLFEALPMPSWAALKRVPVKNTTTNNRFILSAGALDYAGSQLMQSTNHMVTWFCDEVKWMGTQSPVLRLFSALLAGEVDNRYLAPWQHALYRVHRISIRPWQLALGIRYWVPGLRILGTSCEYEDIP